MPQHPPTVQFPAARERRGNSGFRLQYVRKVSGFTKPSHANDEAFERAVDEVADAARKLILSLHVPRRPATGKSRARKARERSRLRFGQAMRMPLASHGRISSRPRVGADFGRAPALQGRLARAEDLDLQRMASRRFAGIGLATVASRTRRPRADEVDFGEEFDEISRAHRACLHEIAVEIAL